MTTPTTGAADALSPRELLRRRAAAELGAPPDADDEALRAALLRRVAAEGFDDGAARRAAVSAFQPHADPPGMAGERRTAELAAIADFAKRLPDLDFAARLARWRSLRAECKSRESVAWLVHLEPLTRANPSLPRRLDLPPERQRLALECRALPPGPAGRRLAVALSDAPENVRRALETAVRSLPPNSGPDRPEFMRAPEPAKVKAATEDEAAAAPRTGRWNYLWITLGVLVAVTRAFQHSDREGSRASVKRPVIQAPSRPPSEARGPQGTAQLPAGILQRGPDGKLQIDREALKRLRSSTPPGKERVP